MNEQNNSVKKKFWDEKSLRCMGISTAAHVLFLIVIYIAMMPASGSEGDDMIDVSFESVATEDNDNNQDSSESSSEEYQPDLSENIENIENDLEDVVDDSYDESEYIKQQYDKLRNQDNKANQDKKNIGNNLVKRSKYGPLTPRMFYGVRIFARNVIFVLDISGSMNIYEAVLQLRNAYHSLKEGESFNIILYSDNAVRWQSEIQTATQENKELADQWLSARRRRGGTNMYDGLRQAFEIARGGKDTIFFLTDGHPTAGKVTNPQQLLKTVALWNSDKQVTIHTIGLGAHQDEGFLESLAGQNDGVYYKR
ncbi:vWA domain-containing protein [Candidatus Uabimicrobium amorphum]|uniref:Marine proteobacterial sortase target protein n=1 Tax=Uabimicrobium amorphum TaxID=2596890 RepID=A0A5S9F6V0_UABAM|nr:VWA domain-containing protein [Candidatus Uabimicrobium amorphum]BBM88266.1 marine proteobacterial sortase target protein [Candidatus Uabimicrobium amorphum]